jgi:hypothetical protein
MLELLITVVIISVLVSILLPTLSMVRESARSIGCINNLRQIGAGDMAYAADNRGMVVPVKNEWNIYNASLSNPHSGDYSTDWKELMFEYLAKNGSGAKQREVYTCPQARLVKTITQWPSSYGANMQVHPHNVINKGGDPTPGLLNSNSHWSYIRAAQIPRPTEIISFMDASQGSQGTSTDFLDYTMPNSSTLSASNKWRADQQADGPFGSNMWFQNANSEKFAYFPRWRHQRNTRGGVVFVDGHAVAIGRTQTLIRNFSTAY